MRELVGRLRMAAGILRYGGLEVGPSEVSTVRARIPTENPLESELGQTARGEAAMTLMDEDCYGFMVVTVHRDDGEQSGEVRIAHFVEEGLWPPLALTLWRVVREVIREP